MKHTKNKIWLEQNLAPRRTSVIMSVIEQMIETRALQNLLKTLSVGRTARNSPTGFGWMQNVSKQ